jgi:hypothetical protein
MHRLNRKGENSFIVKPKKTLLALNNGMFKEEI